MGCESDSYVGSIDQIRGNDFNLNIPRYVDTFEAAVIAGVAS